MAFVPCSRWVKRGTAIANPEKIALSRDELTELVESERVNEDELSDTDDEDADKYNFNSYDQEDDNVNQLGIGSIALYSSRNNDPYVNISGMDDEDSDDEDDIIKSTDNLIIVGKSFRDNGGADNLEVHIYNEEDKDMYVHHDILLSYCPLSIEIVTLQNENTETFIAVGGISPIIEIYDLNIINPVKPTAKLGKKKKHSPNIGHQAAVLDLSWNTSYEHILASSSADKSVILWDLETLEPSTNLPFFTGNVENIEWNPELSQCLLACTNDSCVKLLDCRDISVSKEWHVEGEALIGHWNNEKKKQFLMGTSEGKVYKYDIRKSQPLWEIDAHDCDVTGLSLVPGYPGLLVSCSVNGCLKLWDVSTTPRNIFSKLFDLEQLHTLSFNPDVPTIGCLGGAKKKGCFFQMINLVSLADSVRNWSTFVS